MDLTGCWPCQGAIENVEIEIGDNPKKKDKKEKKEKKEKKADTLIRNVADALNIRTGNLTVRYRRRKARNQRPRAVHDRFSVGSVQWLTQEQEDVLEAVSVRVVKAPWP